MATPTVEEAKKKIGEWLAENGHTTNLLDDGNANFHFEVDYPGGTEKRQRIIQPSAYPDLCLVLTGVAIAEEHKEKLGAMSREERDGFYNEIRKALIFLDNSYDMSTDESGVAQQIQFSYEFYLDSLTKTQLFKSLLLNHRTLLYIVTVFNEKFGIPATSTEIPPQKHRLQ
ncbi:MAG: DUF2299 family protein [Thermodesulfobacteriota bacterium]